MINLCFKSGFLSRANLNKTPSNPLEGQGEAGGVKAERNFCSQIYDWNLINISVSSSAF